MTGLRHGSAAIPNNGCGRIAAGAKNWAEKIPLKTAKTAHSGRGCLSFCSDFPKRVLRLASAAVQVRYLCHQHALTGIIGKLQDNLAPFGASAAFYGLPVFVGDKYKAAIQNPLIGIRI